MRVRVSLEEVKHLGYANMPGTHAPTPLLSIKPHHNTLTPFYRIWCRFSFFGVCKDKLYRVSVEVNYGVGEEIRRCKVDQTPLLPRFYHVCTYSGFERSGLASGKR